MQLNANKGNPPAWLGTKSYLSNREPPPYDHSMAVQPLNALNNNIFYYIIVATEGSNVRPKGALRSTDISLDSLRKSICLLRIWICLLFLCTYTII